MRKLLLAVGLFLLCVSQVQAGVSVAVVGGGDASYNELAAQLNDDTYYDFTATAVSVWQVDTLAELASYDVVVLGDSGHSDNGYSSQMYSAMRSFLDAGGGIVTAGWYSYGTDLLSGQAKVDADYITPIADINYNFYSGSSLVSISNDTHDITDGISDYSYRGSHMEFSTGIDSGAHTLGTIGSSSSAVIVYQDLTGRSVYLGGLYMASTEYRNSGLRSGVEDQLLEQAVFWASEASTPTVPAPGAVLLAGLGTSIIGWVKRRAL